MNIKSTTKTQLEKSLPMPCGPQIGTCVTGARRKSKVRQISAADVRNRTSRTVPQALASGASAKSSAAQVNSASSGHVVLSREFFRAPFVNPKGAINSTVPKPVISPNSAGTSSRTSATASRPATTPLHPVNFALLKCERQFEQACARMKNKLSLTVQDIDLFMQKLESHVEALSTKTISRSPKPKASESKKLSTTIPNEYSGTQLLRITEVCTMVEIKRSTLYSWIAKGTFPAPTKLSSKMSRWPLDEVEAWIAEHRKSPT